MAYLTSYWWRKLLPGLGMVLATYLIADGLWIHAKAILAQQLIERSWQQTLNSGEASKPWPWADTWPVARLEVKKQGIDLYVLYGAYGSALAFGPGYLMGSAEPGADGTSIIAGHRDTHFRFMEGLESGDLLQLTDRRGRQQRYRVETLSIVDSREQWLSAPLEGNQLILVTCYPFNAINSGGPLRYVAKAVLEEHTITEVQR